MMIPVLLFGLAAELTPATAPRLKEAWTYHSHATAPDSRTARIAAFEATPVLGNGQLYVITPFDQVIALDPGTGAERWRYDAHVAASRGYRKRRRAALRFRMGWCFSVRWTRG